MSTLTAPFRLAVHMVRGAVGFGMAVPRAVARTKRSSGRPKPLWPPDDEGGAGVREPRRPKPRPPAGAVAAREPIDEP